MALLLSPIQHLHSAREQIWDELLMGKTFTGEWEKFWRDAFFTVNYIMRRLLLWCECFIFWRNWVARGKKWKLTGEKNKGERSKSSKFISPSKREKGEHSKEWASCYHLFWNEEKGERRERIKTVELEKEFLLKEFLLKELLNFRQLFLNCIFSYFDSSTFSAYHHHARVDLRGEREEGEESDCPKVHLTASDPGTIDARSSS